MMGNGGVRQESEGASPLRGDRATDERSPSSGSSPSRVGIAGAARFTPGPWHYRPNEHDDWGLVRATPEDARNLGGFICQARDPAVFTEGQLAEHRRNGTDPWEANARLIAAAPDLYEALHELAYAADACAPQYEESPNHLQSLVTEAYAALARARGEGE